MDFRSLAIGLGIPTVCVTVVPPFIAASSQTVLGIPLLFAWLFACFPLTTVCMAISWYMFDRPIFAETRGDV